MTDTRSAGSYIAEMAALLKRNARNTHLLRRETRRIRFLLFALTGYVLGQLIDHHQWISLAFLAGLILWMWIMDSWDESRTP